MYIFVTQDIEDFPEGAYEVDGLTALGIFVYHLQGAELVLEDDEESGEWALFFNIESEDSPAMIFSKPEQPLKQYLKSIPQGGINENMLFKYREILKKMFGLQSSIEDLEAFYMEVRQFVAGGLN